MSRAEPTQLLNLPTIEGRRYLSAERASRVYCIDAKYIRTLQKLGEIPAYRFRNAMLFRVDDLEEYFASHQIGRDGARA